MATRDLIDQSRYARWVNASHSIDAVLPGAATIIQGLGKLDAKLVCEDANFRDLPQEQRASLEQSLILTERFTLSYLWVLGAYEVTRATWDRVDKKPERLPKRFTKRLASLKREFARLRMPLAKLEPANAHPNDLAIARPAMHRELGISWRVASRTFIPRRKLSDKLLALLEAIEKRREKGHNHLTSRSAGRAKRHAGVFRR